MRKILVFAFAAVIVAAMAGCGNTHSSSEPGSSQSQTVQSQSAAEPESSKEESQAAATGTGMKDGKTMEGFVDAVNEIYYEMSPEKIDDAMLKDLYMVNPEDVEAYVGETSLVNIQAFDILVIQAKEGKVEDVKAALEQRKQNRISEFEFYPVNGNDEHTKNALVLTSGDYAILVICDNYDSVQKVLDEYFTF
ncbi:MAG: DUF4358 domain-containing protein [Oscillospiraceae bacterium]|nr:DUF4358 domain-containing protein [Oscillospiraceae bacterium]